MTENPETQYVHDDPAQVKEAKVKAKVKSNQEADDIKQLMAIPAFRRFIWMLIGMSHFMKTSFSETPEKTAFLEGERNIGLKVFVKIQEHAPEAYAVMAKENSEGATR